MEGRRLRLSRRAALGALGALTVAPRSVSAFGQAEAFHARRLMVGGRPGADPRDTASSRWAWELVRRTSAPGRLVAQTVGADSDALLTEPFVVWAGSDDVGVLSHAEVRGLERFLRLGGLLLADDSDPRRGTFGKSVRREMARALPDSPVVQLDSEHVVYKTFYMLEGPAGRVDGAAHADAIVRGGTVQAIFLSHDLLGALARARSGGWAFEVEGGPAAREAALRFAVNVAMYVLCSDYKDDQVHAPFLMRRRAKRR